MNQGLIVSRKVLKMYSKTNAAFISMLVLTTTIPALGFAGDGQQKFECESDLGCAIDNATGNTKTHVRVYPEGTQRTFWIHPLQVRGEQICGKLSHDKPLQDDDQLWYTIDCNSGVTIDKINRGGVWRTVNKYLPFLSVATGYEFPSVSPIIKIADAVHGGTGSWENGAGIIINRIAEEMCR